MRRPFHRCGAGAYCFVGRRPGRACRCRRRRQTDMRPLATRRTVVRMERIAWTGSIVRALRLVDSRRCSWLCRRVAARAAVTDQVGRSGSVWLLLVDCQGPRPARQSRAIATSAIMRRLWLACVVYPRWRRRRSPWPAGPRACRSGRLPLPPSHDQPFGRLANPARRRVNRLPSSQRYKRRETR